MIGEIPAVVVAYGFSAACLLAAAPVALRRTPVALLSIPSVVLAVFVGVTLSGGALAPVGAEAAVRVAAAGIWLFLLAALIEDYGLLWRWLVRASAMAVALSTAAMAVGLFGTLFATTSENMVGSYALLPAGCVFVEAFLRRPSARMALALALATIGAVGFGARGPAGVLMGFFAIRVVSLWRWKRLLIVAGAVAAGAGVLCLAAARGGFTRFASAALEHLGMSPRVLTYFGRGALLDGRGRGEIAQAALDAIWQHPFGVGPLADRARIGDRVAFEGLEEGAIVGLYPHNIVLEVILQWGIAGGSLLLVALVLLIRAAFRRRPAAGPTLWVGIGFGLMPLFVSGSYLTYSGFWALLGLSLGATGKFKSTQLGFSGLLDAQESVGRRVHGTTVKPGRAGIRRA
ncbi:MAG: O-antigen ligase family protein [Bifidobacteriaceae bacterium]|nr:O-antigen ligase family protein [Bifidobacteriaceae bacterium]